MRILQVHCGYRVPAGEDTVVSAEAALLRGRGHTVEQHLVQNPTSKPTAVASILVSPYNMAAIRRVRRAAETFQPDVVHVHNTWFALGSSILPALHQTGIRVVMTMHNYRPSCISVDLFRDDAVCTRCIGSSPLPGILHRCYRGSLRLSVIAAADSSYHMLRRTLHDNVDAYIAPSAFMRDRLLEMGFDAERLIVKPHFVGDDGLRSIPARDCRRVLFVGRLAPGKGVAALLRAWERLGDSNLTLTIVGDGPLSSALREMAPRGVEFLGWADRSHVIDLMRSSRALAFPSEWYEPFGMVLLEAMAAGLPIVVNNVADAATITDAHPRLIGIPSNDDSLAQRLLELEDDELIAAESIRMRHRYETLYTPEANGPQLERIYRDQSPDWSDD